MTDIVLINPPLSLEERYGHLSPGGSLMPPLGLCNLAAVTREKGYKTEIVDSVALCLDFEETVGKILALSPKYVGITAATVSIHSAAKFANLLKKTNNKATIIIGGPHLTAVPYETMERFPEFDIGVIGEGEDTISELLEGLESGRELRGIRGLIIRNESKLFMTEGRPFIEDLDTLPMPAWDLLPSLPEYYRPSLLRLSRLPATGLVTSRGCTGKCIFCDRSVFGNRCRAHSADYVIEMIKLLHFKYKMKEIFIFDDNFIIFRSRLFKICETLMKENLDLTWSCFARIDFITPEVLEAMKEAGCRTISYGVETGSQDILNFLEKGIDLEKAVQVLRWTKEKGIMTRALFMIGLPGETEETMRMTINFAKRREIDDIAITIFTPLPGAKLTDDIEKYGEFENDWRKMSQHYPVFVPSGLQREDIEKYCNLAYKEFYLRPRIICKFLSRMDSFAHLRGFIKAGIPFIKTLFRD